MSKATILVSTALAIVCSTIAYSIGRGTANEGSPSGDPSTALQARLRGVESALHACEAKEAGQSSASHQGEIPPTPPRSNSQASIKPALGPRDRRFELAGTNLKVLRAYGPLLRRLDLSASNERAMINLLGDRLVSVEAVQREQTGSKIAALLDAKGQQALKDYELTLPARLSLDRLDYDLQSLGMPLSPEQKEFLVSSITEIREARPAPDISSNTLEAFESFVEYVDETDHRILEQSQAILGAEQTRYLHYYFEAESAARQQSLEWTRKRREQGNPNEPLRWRPPGSI